MDGAREQRLAIFVAKVRTVRCTRRSIAWRSAAGSTPNGVTRKTASARFYRLNRAGRQRLALERDSWRRYARAVSRMLELEPEIA
jgi:hypothetical protein